MRLWKCRAVESQENQKQVFLPSHCPWKSLRDSHIPTASTMMSLFTPKERTPDTTPTLQAHPSMRKCSRSQPNAQFRIRCTEYRNALTPRRRSLEKREFRRMGAGEGLQKNPRRLTATGSGERNRLEMYAGIGDIWRGGRRPMASTNGLLALVWRDLAPRARHCKK